MLNSTTIAKNQKVNYYIVVAHLESVEELHIKLRANLLKMTIKRKKNIFLL